MIMKSPNRPPVKTLVIESRRINRRTKAHTNSTPLVSLRRGPCILGTAHAAVDCVELGTQRVVQEHVTYAYLV